MFHKKSKNATPDQLNQVFEFVEVSLRAENILLPTEDIYCNEEEVLEGLPLHLQDPMAVLEMGRDVLANGLNVHVKPEQNEEIENELAQAARNGSSIPENILRQMHADRDQVEYQDAE